jgi:HK97 family phage prohead protease
MTMEGDQMTVTTSEALRAAADLRRLAADAERHEHGDTAYLRYRSTVPGVDPSAWRHGAPTPRELRAATEVRNGKELVHTFGYFTRYNMRYPMWDTFGEYRERVRTGSGARSLAARPEVAFLTNHSGMAMARTTADSLELREDEKGGWHDGWLNPKRNDVHDLVIAIDDRDVPQMSYAFMIPEGMGEWSADFTDFEIIEWDINGGDVSACNFGANPYTDISARSAEVLDEVTRLPAGAQREALLRLTRSNVAPVRERVEVRSVTREVDPNASLVLRRLQGRVIRTAARFADLANRTGLSIADLATAQLPWYEIRAAEMPPLPPAEEGLSEERIGGLESTDIFIFDEIGGSFGVDAKTFAEDLNAISTPRIKLHINSPGGSVIEGMAIRSSLLHHPSWITAYVDGIAASAASVIALGADEIETMPGAQWMLHDASMNVDGNQAELAKGSTWIGRQSDNMAEIYGTRMGITTEDARQMMLDETWAFAEEAVTLGLADRVGGPNPLKQMPADMTERMSRKHDLTRWGYRYLGRDAAPAPRVTRAGAGRPVETREQAPSAERSTPREPLGRSIALIEAQLASDERS